MIFQSKEKKYFKENIRLFVEIVFGKSDILKYYDVNIWNFFYYIFVFR